MNRSRTLFALLLLVALAATAAARANDLARDPAPEIELLDVGIRIFDAGIEGREPTQLERRSQRLRASIPTHDGDSLRLLEEIRAAELGLDEGGD